MQNQRRKATFSWEKKKKTYYKLNLNQQGDKREKKLIVNIKLQKH